MNTSDIRAGLSESDLGEFSRWATEMIPQMCSEIDTLRERVRQTFRYAEAMAENPAANPLASLDELKHAAALLLAEIRRREPAFTLDAARQSRKWFHARLDDGDEWICWYRNDRLTCIGGDDFPPEHGGEVSKITHIAKMHWPQGAEWVEVKACKE